MKVLKVVKGLLIAAVVIGLLVGFYSTIFWLLDKNARERSAWPTVPGTITAVDSHVADAMDDHDYSYVVSWFDYDVAGRHCQARQKWLVADDGVEAETARFAPGSVVTVYYNPDKPAKAVVRPDVLYSEVIDWIGLAASVLAPFIAAGITVGIGGLSRFFDSLLLGRRKPRREVIQQTPS